ncbi:MAG: hypothetical protein ACRESY_09075 [Steroidobacteraceae bacterium]
MMNLGAFLSIVAVVALVFGIAFVAAPAALLAQYGITADQYTVFISRLFGVALINLGLLLWVARVATDAVTRQAIVLSGLIASALGFVVALHGQMNGVANALGWSTVAIYGVFALGFARFQFGSGSA